MRPQCSRTDSSAIIWEQKDPSAFPNGLFHREVGAQAAAGALLFNKKHYFCDIQASSCIYIEPAGPARVHRYGNGMMLGGYRHKGSMVPEVVYRYRM